MKESYREGIANHPGPEPCEGGGNVALEALDTGICRLGIELRNRQFGEPTASDSQEGYIAAHVSASARRPGRPCHQPEHRKAAGRKGNSQGQALHARWQGVERLHSTNERPEQVQATAGGGSGGKAAGRGDPTAGA